MFLSLPDNILLTVLKYSVFLHFMMEYFESIENGPKPSGLSNDGNTCFLASKNTDSDYNSFNQAFGAGTVFLLNKEGWFFWLSPMFCAKSDICRILKVGAFFNHFNF